jgi:hypothetical protein
MKGAALLLFVVFFLAVSLTLVLSIGSGAYDDLARYRVLLSGKQSFYGAESGIEDAIYRHRTTQNYSNSETFSFGDTSVTVSRTVVVNTYEFHSEGTIRNSVRSSEAILGIGAGASFNFGLQSGNGGITMENTSSVKGNIFSNGSVEGSGSNMVYGDVISAGASGRIEEVHATGSAWAHTIDDSIIDKDAYYQTITGTIVGGDSYPGSPDQSATALPITDEQIEEWKEDAEAGGVILSTDPRCSSGTYIINTDTTLSPIKIECNVTVDKTSTDLYLQGSVWIVGNLLTKSSPNIRVDAAASGRSIAIIVDNPSNRTTSSKITFENSSAFYGNGANSYILAISQNNSSESGGSETAINAKNSLTGQVLLYAGHGKALVENSASLKELTAHRIHLQNSAQVEYESGLANLLFTSGPGGGFTITSWEET